MIRRTITYSGNLAAYLAIVLGLVALVNYFAVQHRFRHDFTASKKYSLSPQTLKTLDRLPFPVKVIAFVKDDPGQRGLPKKMLEQYALNAKNFAWEFSDPDKEPNAARIHNITEYNTFLVTGKEGRSETITGGFSEEKLTNALIRLASGAQKSVYYVKGHGEKDLANREPAGFSSVKELLTGQNYRVADLLLFQEGDIPEDAAAVVVAGPQKDLMENELAKLDAYLARGGKVFILLEPFAAPRTAAWLGKYGITPRNDIVVDKSSRMIGGDVLVPVAVNYSGHPVTKGFKAFTFFPTSRSLLIAKPANGPEPSALALTAPETWGETNEEMLRKKGAVQFDKGKDTAGPLTLAAAADIPAEGGEEGKKPRQGELLVVGDADFACNAYINIGGNRDFFMNVVNWLAAEEDRISIASKSPGMDPLIFSVPQISAIAGITVIGLPALVLFAGIAVVLRRRRS